MFMAQAVEAGAHLAPSRHYDHHHGHRSTVSLVGYCPQTNPMENPAQEKGLK